MPELIIRYNKKETLQALLNLAKTLDFEIAKPFSNKETKATINGVTLVAGDDSIDLNNLNEVFTGRNIDASELRKQAWQRS
jgi:hypothetical protein